MKPTKKDSYKCDMCGGDMPKNWHPWECEKIICKKCFMKLIHTLPDYDAKESK